MDHGSGLGQRLGLDGGSHPPHEQPGIGHLLEDRASQPALAPDAYLSEDRPELLPGGGQVVLAAPPVQLYLTERSEYSKSREGGDAMDRATAIFVEGMGAAAATSGVLTQLQGRIFGFLYLQPGSASLDEITGELGQSKGNISVNIRGLVDWHFV